MVGQKFHKNPILDKVQLECEYGNISITDLIKGWWPSNSSMSVTVAKLLLTIKKEKMQRENNGNLRVSLVCYNSTISSCFQKHLAVELVKYLHFKY